MKLIRQTSPYLRRKSNVSRMMMDVLIALIPVVAFSIYYFGIDAIKVIVTSVLTMVISEFLFVGIINRPDMIEGERKFIRLFTKDNLKKVFKNYRKTNFFSSLVSAIIFAMIMPAGVSIFILVIGALAGIILGKLVFGGLGSNIFNPAAVGRIFVSVCGFDLVSTKIDAQAGATPLTILKEVISGNSEIYSSVGDFLANTNYSTLDLLLGKIPGAIGEVCAIAIILGGVYLFLRKSADLRSCLSMIFGFSFVILFTGIALKCNVLDFYIFNILTGGLLFGAVFMVTDPVTSPITGRGRILFGLFVGIIAAIIRVFGAYPEGVAFAILIMNMLVPVIDYYKWSGSKYTKKYIISVAVILFLIATVLIVNL